ncbi:MAG: TorF family putative porin [Alphaproteobacteria bacterium]
MASRSFLPLALAAALVAAPALADDKKSEKLIPGEFTATVTLATDYLYRGISQTDENPAIQGSIDYSYMFKEDFGVYLGVWASNLNFNDGNEATIEMDVYGGVKGKVVGLDWQLGMIGYFYPGASSRLNYDFYEFAGKLGYDFGFASVAGGLNYSPDFFGASGDAWYLYGDVKVPIPGAPLELAVIGHLGHQWIEKNDRFGTPDYLEWQAGLTATVEGFTLSLVYADTDLKKSECLGGKTICGARALFSISRTF